MWRNKAGGFRLWTVGCGLWAACLLMPASTTFGATPGRWNPETTDWASNPNPEVGDWGFDRPGYDPGLYIHGITVPPGEPMTNPFIYDNDECSDVRDDEYILAKASVGEANFVAFIATPVMASVFTSGNGYIPQWEQTFYDSYNWAASNNMCMDLIPEVTVGCIYNTGPMPDSAGAQLIVELAHQYYDADPNKPVFYSIGGQANSLASAWFRDPTIGDKIIVYYTDIVAYNGHDEWASSVVAQNFRVVNWGDRPNWWNHQCPGCDTFGDGTFMHAWDPGCFIDALIAEPRFQGTGAHVLWIQDYSPEPFHELGLVRFDPDATDGICPTLLEPPTNLTATAVSSSEVHLTWQDNSTDPQEAGFAIERKPYLGGNFWQKVGQVGSNTTVFTDTDNLHGNVQYVYRVGAFDN